MISLGCAKNRVDSEIMLGELRAQGYELASDVDLADTVIVNTCGFVEEARKESIDAILEVAARKGRRQAPARRRLHGEPPRRGAGPRDPRDRRLRRASTSCGRSTRWCSSAAGRRCRRRRTWCSTTRRRDCSPPAATPTSRSPKAATTLVRSAPSRSGAGASAAAPSTAWCSKRRSSRPPASRSSASSPRTPRASARTWTASGWESKAERRHGLLRLVEALLARTNIPWIRFLYAYPTTLDRELLRLMGQEPRFCLVPRHPAAAQPSRGALRDAPRRQRRALPAAARRGARARPRRLPAHYLHHRLPRRDRGALRSPAALRRGGALRPPRRLRLQPRGGDSGRRAAGPRARGAWRAGVGRSCSPRSARSRSSGGSGSSAAA